MEAIQGSNGTNCQIVIGIERIIIFIYVMKISPKRSIAQGTHMIFLYAYMSRKQFDIFSPKKQFGIDGKQDTQQNG
jgi:hypothetical protein